MITAHHSTRLLIFHDMNELGKLEKPQADNRVQFAAALVLRPKLPPGALASCNKQQRLSSAGWGSPRTRDAAPANPF